jgi:hypothetical protein
MTLIGMESLQGFRFWILRLKSRGRRWRSLSVGDTKRDVSLDGSLRMCFSQDSGCVNCPLFLGQVERKVRSWGFPDSRAPFQDSAPSRILD